MYAHCWARYLASPISVAVLLLFYDLPFLRREMKVSITIGSFSIFYHWRDTTAILDTGTSTVLCIPTHTRVFKPKHRCKRNALIRIQPPCVCLVSKHVTVEKTFKFSHTVQNTYGVAIHCLYNTLILCCMFAITVTHTACLRFSNLLSVFDYRV